MQTKLYRAKDSQIKQCYQNRLSTFGLTNKIRARESKNKFSNYHLGLVLINSL